jgi:hypothetical protein
MALACAARRFPWFRSKPFFLPARGRKILGATVSARHGIVFFTWSLYFVFQAGSRLGPGLALHRSVGMIGVSLRRR